MVFHIVALLGYVNICEIRLSLGYNAIKIQLKKYVLPFLIYTEVALKSRLNSEP